MFPGYINKASGADVEFTPLVKTGQVSGLQQYSRMVQRHFLFGPQLNLRGLPHRPNSVDYTIAAGFFRRSDPDIHRRQRVVKN